MKVDDIPPPIGTGAIVFWHDRSYQTKFVGLTKGGMWRFDNREDFFFLTPGSHLILQYLPAGQLTCVDKSIETDSQLGP